MTDDAARPRPRPRPTSAPQAPTLLEAADGRPPSRTRSTIALVLVAVLALGLIALNAWLFVVRSDNSDVEQARHDALASARQRVPAMLSYDYKKIDSYIAGAPGNATGKFKADFGQLVTRVIAPAAKQQRITTDATVKNAGVVAASADEVTVLVLLDQKTTSKTAKNGRLDGSRDRVVMRKVGDTWLVASLDPI